MLIVYIVISKYIGSFRNYSSSPLTFFFVWINFFKEGDEAPKFEKYREYEI